MAIRLHHLNLAQGNCISLAVLTQSYAQTLGLKTSFQEMTSEPVYAQEDNLVYVALMIGR